MISHPASKISGISLLVLATLLIALLPSACLANCPSGMVPGSMNKCHPAGTQDCGNGTYCESGSSCTSDNWCVGNGRTYCGGHQSCPAGSKCVPGGCADEAAIERRCGGVGWHLIFPNGYGSEPQCG